MRKILTRLTFDQTTDLSPLWSPDGKQIVFFSARNEQLGICRKAADGTGEIELLTSTPNQRILPSSWSGDGRLLALAEFSSGIPIKTVILNTARYLMTPRSSLGTPADARIDIGLMSLEGNRERKPLLRDKYFEGNPRISSDGRWLAYTSNESGRNEIYVRPFPDVNSGKWQVSGSGGRWPKWSSAGEELFYRSGDAVMAIAVERGTTFKAGVPQKLFQGDYCSQFGGWDVHPDGKRFLMIKEPPAVADGATAEAPNRIVVVLNWTEELKQRVPAP